MNEEIWTDLLRKTQTHTCIKDDKGERKGQTVYTYGDGAGWMDINDDDGKKW